MEKKDFMSYDEYVKKMTSPPAPPKEEKPVLKMSDHTAEAASDDADDEYPFDRATQDDYEVYKLDWLIEHGYTLQDVFMAVVNFAVENKKERLLEEAPDELFELWEEKGFGINADTFAMYDNFDTWLTEYDEDDNDPDIGYKNGSKKAEDDDDMYDRLSEIVDLIDRGFSAEELKSLGYSKDDVDRAIQWESYMGVPV